MGNWQTLGGVICRSLEDRDFVLAVSPLVFLRIFDTTLILITCEEDFALMEASCVIVKLIQAFPNMRLPAYTPVLPLGEEKQAFTVFLSPADGCKVALR